MDKSTFYQKPCHSTHEEILIALANVTYNFLHCRCSAAYSAGSSATKSVTSLSVNTTIVKAQAYVLTHLAAVLHAVHSMICNGSIPRPQKSV